MEHCEHSRWSCQRNNGSLRINFSAKKKASLCYHSIMAFICNLDLGWLLSNAFSLCYQEGKKKNPCSLQGTSQDQMVPIGIHHPSPEPFWRKPENKEKVSKSLPGERWGAVQGAGNKHSFFIRKQSEDKHPCVLSCPGAWIQGTEGATVTAVCGHSACESRSHSGESQGSPKCWPLPADTSASSWLLQGPGSKIKPGKVTLKASAYQIVLCPTRHCISHSHLGLSA